MARYDIDAKLKEVSDGVFHGPDKVISSSGRLDGLYQRHQES